MQPRQQRADSQEPNGPVSIPVHKPVPIDSPSQRAVPGFIADHVIPLRKGGPDAVETFDSSEKSVGEFRLGQLAK